MSENPNVSPAAAEAEKHRRWIVIAVVVVAVMVVLALAIRSASWSSGAAPQEAASTSIRDELAATEEGILAAVEEQRRSLARAKLHELRQAADNIDHVIGEIETENAAWNEHVVTLLQSDEGRALAASEQHVKAFDTLLRRREPTARLTQAARARLKVLLQPVDAALAGEAELYEPAPDILEQLQQERERLADVLAQQRDARQTIQSLLREAQRVGAPAPITLEEAIARLNQGYASERAALLAAARERAERANREKLVATEERKLLEIGEAERARREAELEAQRVELDTETKLLQEQTRVKRLRALAEDPAIQAKYEPFLKKGAYVFGSKPGTGCRTYQPPQPASYNRLVSTEVLTDITAFVKAACGDRFYGRNDRPQWKYPQSEAEWEKYRALFEEFRELAPVWRDMGLLQN